MRLSHFFGLSVAAIALAAVPVSRSLAADPAAAAFSPEQTDALNQMIHDYIVKNPKVMIEALQHAEEMEKAEELEAKQSKIDQFREELEQDPTSPVLGNLKGDVTLVEFFDYRCPYCKGVAATMENLIQKDNKIRVVYKELPVLGDESVAAARVALVADRHHKYAQVHTAMLGMKGKVTLDSALDVAKSAGLDPVMVKKEMNSPEIDLILKNNYALAKKLGVNGTPAFFIGKQLAPGLVSAEQLDAMIATARKPG